MNRRILTRIGIAIGLTAIGVFFWWQYFGRSPARGYRPRLHHRWNGSGWILRRR